MVFKQNRRIRRYFLLTVTAFFLLPLTACGGGNSDSSIAADADNGTGELSFDVIFQDDDEDRQRQAAVTDCAGLGIATVEAMVYDQGNNFLVGGGPWDCDSGQGTVTAVPAGSGHIVAILAKDSEGRLAYRGQKAEVNVMAGESNNIGTISCNAFALKPPQNPADGSTLPFNAVRLTWTSVEGASIYRVIISANNDLSNPVINHKTPKLTYSPSVLTIGNTYYWQVIPIDTHDNQGIGAQIWTFTINESTDNTQNLLLDPTFSRTTSNEDKRYWNWAPIMEWGATYGYNSTPGFRYTIGGAGNAHWLAEQNGSSSQMNHPVKVGDKFLVQCRVMQSEGADGIFGITIQERDAGKNFLRPTNIEIYNIPSDGTWQLVTAPITVSDENAAYCHLLITPIGGTTGFFYIDDVIFSRIEPTDTPNVSDNMIQDPKFQLTQSNTDTRFWWLDNPTESNVEWNTFNSDGLVDVNGNPAIKFYNRADGGPNYLWEKNSIPANFLEKTFPISSGEKFYVEASVFESIDSTADNLNSLSAVIWAGDNNREFQSFNWNSIRPSTKGSWETVSAEIEIVEQNPDDYNVWIPTITYNKNDIIKHDTDGTGDYLIYKCLNDNTSGAATEPPDNKHWARYDNPQLGNFGIYSNDATTGYFIVDDIVLSKVETVDIESNMLLDPTFSKTSSNSDKQYWSWLAAIEWGAAYGYNSTGFRFTIDGNWNWLAEQDGKYASGKHPVNVGDRLWIQCRVKRSEGADGTFHVGVQVWDKDNYSLSNTLAEISISAGDDIWQVVKTSVTIADANAEYCHLLIISNGGTTGYFYVDDVIFSRQEPIEH